MEKLKGLTDQLNNLLADEDLDDDKLRDASEGLLPNLADELNARFRSTRQQVYDALDGERDYQDWKWNTSERKKPTESYMLYMKAYLDEAIQKISHEAGDFNALDILRKVVALGVACFEDNGVPPRGDVWKTIKRMQNDNT